MGVLAVLLSIGVAKSRVIGWVAAAMMALCKWHAWNIVYLCFSYGSDPLVNNFFVRIIFMMKAK